MSVEAQHLQAQHWLPLHLNERLDRPKQYKIFIISFKIHPHQHCVFAVKMALVANETGATN